MATSSEKHNVTVWRPSVCPSVCPVGILIVIHQQAAGSVLFGPTITRNDMLVHLSNSVTESTILQLDLSSF